MALSDTSVPRLLIRYPVRIMVVSAGFTALAAAALAASVLFFGHGGPPGAAAGSHPVAAPALPAVFRLLTAVAVIGGLAHLGGRLARRVGQPSVVGEITAGILLGPSLLGHFLPSVSRALFPLGIRADLSSLAQVGVMLFMFAVGVEFDPGILRRQRGAISMLSQATMVVPFAVAVMVVPMLYTQLAGAGASRSTFVIFMGTAISITAFPVLARIVQDLRLTGTRLGNLAMICACVNDVMAWCALAAVMSVITAGSAVGALWRLPAVAVIATLLLLVVKPLLQRASDRLAGRKASTAARLVPVLLLVFSLAALTDRIGVNTIFGAFVAGLILPRGSAFLGDVPERLGQLNRALLLPVFFASTGLALDLTGVFTRTSYLLTAALILLLAVGTKLGSATLCARAGGMSWRDSLGLGMLLNARGVTEIVVLTTGLQIGVINRTAFTIMVLMALVTTGMTAPLLRRLGHGAPLSS
ncbi:cation:proton antiporter [Streptacidiphilus sp. EB129]|uniref:cation:proton antiporter n=1 Tax=Streptacidiphilus sp. EB129 TaxID=3156262 RepID=UPI003518E1B1